MIFYVTFETLIKIVAENIRRTRKQLGLTQEEMQNFGFNYRYYQSLEEGRTNPTLRTLWLVAQALKISVYDLIHEDKGSIAKKRVLSYQYPYARQPSKLVHEITQPRKKIKKRKP